MVRLIKNNIEFTKGDTCLLRCVLTDENNEPVDVSETTGILTVKEYLNDATLKEKISLSYFDHEDSDPEGGIVYFKFLPSHTQGLAVKKYYYDIQITRGTDIYTIRQGDLYFLSEIKFNV
jgi:hypothetical protein